MSAHGRVFLCGVDHRFIMIIDHRVEWNPLWKRFWRCLILTSRIKDL